MDIHVPCILLFMNAPILTGPLVGTLLSVSVRLEFPSHLIFNP